MNRADRSTALARIEGRLASIRQGMARARRAYTRLGGSRELLAQACRQASQDLATLADEMTREDTGHG